MNPVNETELGREVRQNTKRIVAELTRIHDRYEGADWAGIRPADAKLAADTITQLEAHKAACTCEAHRPGFEVNTRNDRPYHTELALKQAGRVRAMDQAGNYDAVLATVENHRAAGLRETTDAAMRGML